MADKTSGVGKEEENRVQWIDINTINTADPTDNLFDNVPDYLFLKSGPRA